MCLQVVQAVRKHLAPIFGRRSFATSAARAVQPTTCHDYRSSAEGKCLFTIHLAVQLVLLFMGLWIGNMSAHMV